MGKCGALVRNRNPVATATYMRLADLCRDEFQSLGLLESIPASDSLVLKFADRIDTTLLQGRIEKLADPAIGLPATVGKTHVMHVDFSAGLDWEFATKHTGISREEYIEMLCSVELTVAMLGFLPGFAYLEGLPKKLHLPRRPSPRASVTPGSIAIGGEYCGIYRLPCPGGWQILGQVDLATSDSIDQLLCQFSFGDRVQLVSQR